MICKDSEVNRDGSKISGIIFVEHRPVLSRLAIKDKQQNSKNKKIDKQDSEDSALPTDPAGIVCCSPYEAS